MRHWYERSDRAGIRLCIYLFDENNGCIGLKPGHTRYHCRMDSQRAFRHRFHRIVPTRATVNSAKTT